MTRLSVGGVRSTLNERIVELQTNTMLHVANVTETGPSP